MKQTVIVLLTCAFLCLVNTSAFAKLWTIDYTNSKITFTGTQGSSGFNGSFKNFQATVDFDPDHLDTSKISTTIDIAGVTAGSQERDSYLPQADWFNLGKFPQAEFISTSIRKTGENLYTADGTLTIKGIKQPVSLPFTLVQEGDHWHAFGRTTLMRNDFHIGEGQWANESFVKYAVDVMFDITAKPNT